MSRSTLRSSIIILTLITALVHLVVLNIGIYNDTGSIEPLFTLNGLGYFGFLWALLNPPGFLRGKDILVHYGFMAYAAVTILAWALINGDFSDPVGVGTKVVEVLLIVALWLHLKSAE